MLTIHYRGAHAAAARRSGFTSFKGSSARVGGGSMTGLIDEIEKALAAPDSLVESVSDSETRLYYRYLSETLVGPKHLCVVVKVRLGNAFVITAYLTDKVKKGRVLWPTAV